MTMKTAFFLLVGTMTANVAACLSSIHPVLFPLGSSTTDGECQSLVVFLHGRLEADKGEPPFAPPSELYSEFMDQLSCATQLSSTTTYLLEYHEALASRQLSQEPRDLGLGPISGQLQESIRDLITVQHKPLTKVTLITYSMGAAMGLKLLHHNPDVFERAVLIEPVWRCWLPFVVSHPRSLSQVPTLALYGTHDSLTRDDSGKSVLGSLRAFLPHLEVVAIQGGNHWGILNGDLPIARQDLAVEMTASQVKTNIVAEITRFCEWDIS